MATLALLVVIAAAPAVHSRPAVVALTSVDVADELSRPELLNVEHIHLGMTREAVRQLHLSADDFPKDIAYDRSGHVAFASGPMLCRDNDVIAVTATVATRWGRPVARGMVGTQMVECFRAGSAFVIMRYTPPALSARMGGVAEFSVARNVSYIPNTWGQAMIHTALAVGSR